MKVLQSLAWTAAVSIVGLSISLGSPLAQGVSTSQPYEPERGQAGKDVVWIPTPDVLVEKMLDMAEVKPTDFVIDLGSGDGRTVIAAAKRGAKSLGIEYNPDMVELAKRNAAKEGVSDKTEFVKADLFESDFSQATVVALFLLAELNLKLRPKILNMKPGTRVVSNTFDMGDWKADQTVQVADNCTSFCKAYFWLVPAKAEGTWKLPQGELALQQQYQMLTGTLKTSNGAVAITDGKMTGNRIDFKAGGVTYTGTVSGNTMEGSNWRGTRG
jgi:SAM-dependent methyltransferase